MIPVALPTLLFKKDRNVLSGIAGIDGYGGTIMWSIVIKPTGVACSSNSFLISGLSVSFPLMIRKEPSSSTVSELLYNSKTAAKKEREDEP
jgi:hypothetical protein